MLVDGKAIAGRMIQAVADRVAVHPARRSPQLAIITCAPNFETKKYLQLKQKRAVAAGITLLMTELAYDTTTEGVVQAVMAATLRAEAVVVQLPLPAHIDREAVLAAVPVSHDPDGFSYSTNPAACLPPVVAAVVAIATEYNIAFASGQRIVVMGRGRLVGAPMVTYLMRLGVPPAVVTESSSNTVEVLARADIIITGVGKPGLVTPDMVKPGVVIFDAGTSEDGGMLVGDVQKEVAALAKLFTPVPGGIGPITVAALLTNVMNLAEQQWQAMS